MSRTCIICNIEKDDEAFRMQSGGRTDRRTECKECEVIIAERKKDTRSLAERLIAVPAADVPRLPVEPVKRLTAAIALRMDMYRCSAIDALHDLATMPINENSSMMQVKFMAASRLAGPATPGDDTAGKQNYDGIMQELNRRFHSEAPKIREIRERVTTFANGGQTIDVD